MPNGKNVKKSELGQPIFIGDDRCLPTQEDISSFLQIPCRNHLVFVAHNMGDGTVELPEYHTRNKVGEYVTKKNPFTGFRSYEKTQL